MSGSDQIAPKVNSASCLFNKSCLWFSYHPSASDSYLWIQPVVTAHSKTRKMFQQKPKYSCYIYTSHPNKLILIHLHIVGRHSVQFEYVFLDPLQIEFSSSHSLQGICLQILPHICPMTSGGCTHSVHTQIVKRYKNLISSNTNESFQENN